MANIKSELNNIKNAMYGKDVRSSIHNGIDAINKEVESTTNRQVDLESTFDQLVIAAGNSNAEIVDARVKSDGTSYSKLGDRLDAVDSQLAQNVSNVEGVKLDVKNKLAEIDASRNVNIATSIEEMVDKEQLYVFTDTKTWWKYGSYEISSGTTLPTVKNVLESPYVTEVKMNTRLSTSGEEAEAPGSAVIYFDFTQYKKLVQQLVFTPTTDDTRYLILSLKVGEGNAIEETIANLDIRINSGSTNIMTSAEILYGQKYSKSGGGLVTDTTSISMFLPCELSKGVTCTVSIYNVVDVATSRTSTIYLLDANKKNAKAPNDASSALFNNAAMKGIYSETEGIVNQELYKLSQKLLNQDPVWMRMKGASIYGTLGNNEYTKIVGWTAGGSRYGGYSPDKTILLYEEGKDGISDTPITVKTLPYSDSSVAPVYAFKFWYFNATENNPSTNARNENYDKIAEGKLGLSVIVNYSSKSEITEKDMENVYITFDEPIISYGVKYEEEWYDTDIAYIPGEPVTAVELSNRINELTTKVQTIKGLIISNSTTKASLPDYWKDRLDNISPKIEELQKEYGVDAFHFLWASDIHGVPAYAPNNTTHIGAICRYMMDKHNIPFFTISGDIMSQTSHAEVQSIWEEYDKINAMLSILEKDELLAVKGNHDGAWGNPDASETYKYNIGNKQLFNAFYRKQTLDRNRVFGKDGTYFYVDCPNVRIYMLNTHTDGDSSMNKDGVLVYHCYNHYVLGNEQLNWIANSLLTVQEGQKVIFMGHVPIEACVDNSIFTGIVTSYKDRTNYTGTMNITGTYWGTDEKYSKVSVNKDFTNAKGDLVGYFHGHIHKDTISTDGQYPTISISNAGGDNRDSYIKDGTLSRVKGTPTETAMDLVTVTSNYIYFTRIGCGYDRKYNRLTKEITIDYDSAYIN